MNRLAHSAFTVWDTRDTQGLASQLTPDQAVMHAYLDDLTHADMGLLAPEARYAVRVAGLLPVALYTAEEAAHCAMDLTAADFDTLSDEAQDAVLRVRPIVGRAGPAWRERRRSE